MERISGLEKKYVLEALENGFRTSLNSTFNNRFENAFAKLYDSKFAIGLINGTATLHTALSALNVSPGDEVIVPPLTMSSPALAVLQNGTIPVFGDVDARTFNISPEGIERCITEKTRAVMTVSLYGQAPDYDEILKICNNHSLALIEDNAETFLAEYKSKLVGKFGSFASFSFQASKHLTSGEGGALITDDENLANRARRFSSLGYAGVSSKQGKISRDDIQDPKYSRHIALGFNYRMSELNAAVLLAQVERASELVEIRVKAAEFFKQAILGFKFVKPQADVEGCSNSYWTFAFILDTPTPAADWKRFRRVFLEKGGDPFYAAWKLSYLEPLFLSEIQKRTGVWQEFTSGICPIAEYLQPRMVQLKTNYWNLTDAERQASILRQALKELN